MNQIYSTDSNKVIGNTMYNWLNKEINNLETPENQTCWLAVDVESEKSQKSLTVRIGFTSIEVKSGYDPKLLLDVAKTLREIC